MLFSSMVKDGKRMKTVHNFPEYYTENLNWASPELLQQVNFLVPRSINTYVKFLLFCGKACLH